MEEKIEKEINKKSFPILGWYYLIAIIIGAILFLTGCVYVPYNHISFIIHVLIVHSLFTYKSLKNFNNKNIKIILLLGIIFAIGNIWPVSRENLTFCLVYSLIILFTNIILSTYTIYTYRKKNNVNKEKVVRYSSTKIILISILLIIALIFSRILAILGVLIICAILYYKKNILSLILSIVSFILIHFVVLLMLFNGTSEYKKSEMSNYIVSSYLIDHGAIGGGSNVVLYQKKFNCITGTFAKEYYVLRTEWHEKIHSLEWVDEENFTITTLVEASGEGGSYSHRTYNVNDYVNE